MSPTPTDLSRLIAVLIRIANEIDNIDSRLLEMIERQMDSAHLIQSSINDWSPE